MEEENRSQNIISLSLCGGPSLEITNRCISCDYCRLLCPENAILKIDQEYNVEVQACTLCGICIEVCPVDCIKFQGTTSQPSSKR